MPEETHAPVAEVLKTKRHFEILDGLRGVAALCVVTFHFMEMVFYDYSKNFIGHGFLAVDFFFCLSGFVIGYAYDDRMPGMGVLEFLKSRLIRLHPLVVFGSVLGLLAFLFDPFVGHAPAYSAGKIALFFVTSILMTPYPWVAGRGHNLFGLNAPAWSLFWEYVANVVYALVLARVARRFTVVLFVLAAAWLGYVGYSEHSMMGGWSGKTFWDGGARVAYSFLAGLLVYRLRWIIRTKLNFAAMTVLLLAALTMPYFKWNGLAETLVVMVYFPLLVALGAGAVLGERTRKICVFSGKMSYPLYMTHYAALWMFLHYYETHKPDMAHVAMVIVPSVLALVGFAYLVMKLYDTPVRHYLTMKRREALSERSMLPEI